MTNLIRNVGGAVRIGLIWAAVWAPLAVLLGVYIVDPDNSMDEMWLLVGAYPAFLCGVIFFTLLRLVERRRLNEVALLRVAVWGAVSGVLVGAIPLALATPRNDLVGVAVVFSITVLSSVSAVGSALLNVGGAHRT